MWTIALVVIAALLVWHLWELQHRKTRAMSGGFHADIMLPHEQEWELYHNDFSLCSKKSRVCLAELGIHYKPHHIDLIETGSYETLSRHYLKVNPSAVVPVLVHDGHPIYESHDQLEYAAAHSPNPSLLVPQDAAKRALMDHWVHKSSLIGDNPIDAVDETAGNAVPGLTTPIFAAMVTHIPTRRILTGLLFHRLKVRAVFFLALKLFGLKNLPKMKPVIALLHSSKKAMQTHFDELETALEKSGGPWVVGDQFTLADVGIMVIFDRLREGDWLDEFLIDARPNIRAYWKALQERPSYQAGIADHMHPMVTQGTNDIIDLKQNDQSFSAAMSGS
ncbi:glutathione S-transferase family protein [Parvibaculaceae bacterium PLY_AMNH_Bact1]|nr:glutathione S-transferase family protein [Parvibaculaceae bacterium PLY_AMNH_Bact1]